MTTLNETHRGDNKEEELRTALAEKAAMANEMNDLSSRYTTRVQELGAAETEIRELREKLVQTETEVGRTGADFLRRQVADRDARLTEAFGQRDVARAETDTLRQELNDCRTEYTAMEERLTEKAAELKTFKEQVIKVALEVARDNNWCDSGLRETMDKLGLEIGVKKYDATMQVTIQFTGTLVNRRELPEAQWVQESLRYNTLRGAIEEGLRMDYDHSHTSVWGVDVEVTDVSENTDDD